MKKAFSFLIAIIAICSMVSCNSDKPTEPSLPMNEAVYNEDGKAVVTVGTFEYIDPLFNDNLKKLKNIEVNIVNYADGIDYDEESEYIAAKNNALNMAMLSGNAPDIIYMNASDMLNYNRKGILTDLYPLMDNCDFVKREDFLPCVLEGLEIDGKMPALMESYRIYTAMAKTKFIPKEYENWTADEAMKFYVKYSGQMDFYYRTENISLTNFMLKVEGLASIDQKNLTCNFSDIFRKSLQFCVDNPVDVIHPIDMLNSDALTREDYYKDQMTAGLNDTQLVFDLVIDGFNAFYGQNTYGFFNKEDITFVGYPSENGIGTYIRSINPLFAITEQCGNKEAAWEVVSAALKHQKKLEKNMGDSSRGVPVLKEQLQLDYDRPADYVNSINNQNMGDCNHISDEVYITQKYKDILYDYILSVPANPYFYSEKLQNIIDEEVEYAVNNSRTADDTTRILNDRLETYVSEKS